MPIMFVHGRAQQSRDPAALHAAWKDSLLIHGASRAGVVFPPSLNSFFPYYGDQLNQWVEKERKQSRSDDEAFRFLQVNESETAYHELAGELAEIISVRARASGIAATDLATKRKRRGGDDALRRDEDGTRSLKSILGAVHSVAPLASELALAVLKDVAIYLSNDAAYRAVQNIVKDRYREFISASQETGEPRVVVAHSLGSVVALEFLANIEESIDLFLTVGSPLGLDGIRRRLRCRPFWPSQVKQWVNASDSRDIVAISPALGRQNLFSGDYKANKNARCDVLNLTDVDNTTDNHHSITGYLDDPGIARTISQCLLKGDRS